MRKNYIIEIVVLCVMAIAIAGVSYYKWHRPLPPPQVVKAAVSHKIKVIHLLENNDGFDFVIEDGTRIHGVLRGAITPESKDNVIRLMNDATKGKIVIVQEQGGSVVVDVFLTLKNGNEVNLWDWLLQKKLTYQQKPNLQSK